MANVTYIQKLKPGTKESDFKEARFWTPWQALAVDGKIVMEGHSINVAEAFQQMGGHKVEQVKRLQLEGPRMAKGFPNTIEEIRESDKWSIA